MEHQEKKVPNLRFKGFTNDWEQRKLGELFKERAEKSGSGQLLSVSISQGVSPFDESIRKNNSSKDKHNYKVVKINDIAYNSMRMWQGAEGIATVQGIVSPAYTVIIPNSNANPLFFESLFKTSKMLYVFRSHSQGLTSDTWNLKYPLLKKIYVNVPKIHEQEKIANLIRKTEALISLQQRKLDLLKQLKKGMLQKMFADKGSKRPILRFEGFNDDWEGRKLENSADYIRGSFPQPYGNKEWYGGTNAKPFVQVVDVNTNMRLNKKTKEQISVLAQPKSRFVPSDSIVVTLQGSIGRVAITQYDSYVDRTLLIFTKYKVPVDKYFWAYSIQNIFRIEKQKAPGGTIKTITKRALSSFEVNLPVQEEQKKIGTLLKNIDDIITSQQEEVSKLKKIKKSLLQQMFI